MNIDWKNIKQVQDMIFKSGYNIYLDLDTTTYNILNVYVMEKDYINFLIYVNNNDIFKHVNLNTHSVKENLSKNIDIVNGIVIGTSRADVYLGPMIEKKVKRSFWKKMWLCVNYN